MVCANANALQDDVLAHWYEPSHRLHLRHGPIDIIAQAEGVLSEREAAFNQLFHAFQQVLVGITEHLSWLRQPQAFWPLDPNLPATVSRMCKAVQPYQQQFITPMAAVAGSVADYLLSQMCHQRHLRKASVNNGGDIALYLGPNEQFRVGVCELKPGQPAIAKMLIRPEQGINGIATSGWQGRSFSLGVADAVTVLAASASQADAAATMIANHVNCSDESNGLVSRIAAFELDPQSDLGEREVTQQVAKFTHQQKHEALSSGARFARKLVNNKLIVAAWILVQQEYVAINANQLEIISS